MSLTPQNARKELFALVDSIWQAQTNAIIGYIPEVRWQGMQESAIPASSKFWMRVSTKGVSNRQRGFSMPDNGQSHAIFDNIGFITLQIFAPMTSPTGYAKGELLSAKGQCMFMATETGGAIWFRNPRIIELDNDGTWYRWNVVADYQFSQRKGT
jgi:hypothetical protein